MNIEPDTHIEIRQTRSEISVLYEAEYTIAILDGVAQKLEGVIDDALLTRLGYMKRETCHRRNDEDTCGIDVCSECGFVWPDDYSINYCPNCGRRVIA